MDTELIHRPSLTSRGYSKAPEHGQPYCKWLRGLQLDLLQKRIWHEQLIAVSIQLAQSIPHLSLRDTYKENNENQ